MALSASDLKWYYSYGFTGSPIQPYADSGTSVLTGNEGGGITSNQLNTGTTLNEMFRAVRGTDIQSADFYDYTKLYFKNTDAAQDLTDCGLYISEKSAYTQDQMAVAIGLTDSAYTIANGGTDTFSAGREDYDEDTDAGTVCNSPYPRVTGAGTESATIRTTYSVDTTLVTAAGLWKLVTGAATTNACYVKLVGMDANGDVVVGYSDLNGAGAGSRIFKVDRNNAGASVSIARPLYFSVHLHTYDDGCYGGGTGAATAVSNTGMCGPDGYLTDVQHAAAADVTIQWDNAGGGSYVTVGKLRAGDGAATVGQVFVPCFYPESYIDSVSEALTLPTLGGSDPSNGFDQNEYGEQQKQHISIWIRRKVDTGASSAASVLNKLQIFGSSS